MTRRRVVDVWMATAVVVGVLAVAADVTTVRIVPDASTLSIATYNVVPGERIRVEIVDPWASPVRSSRPEVVAPLGGNWFVAATLGSATLSSVTVPPPGSLAPDVLWRVNIDVGLPGT